MTQLSSSVAEQLRQRLNDSRTEVLGHIRARLEGSDEPNAVSLLAHLGQGDDMAQAIEIGDNEMALLGQEQHLLRDIDSAIGRLDAGNANECTVCGMDIPDERLLAIPTAKTCIACQERIEAQTHSHGGPTM